MRFSIEMLEKKKFLRKGREREKENGCYGKLLNRTESIFLNSFAFVDHLIPRFLPFPSEILVEVQPIVERTKILRFRPIFRNLFARRVFVVVGRGMNIFLVQSAKEEKYVNGLGRKRKKKSGIGDTLVYSGAS